MKSLLRGQLLCLLLAASTSLFARSLTNTSHDGFCRVMYDYACRAITWDIEVSVSFQGIAGAPGYRAVNTEKAGWRYGFVALQGDGTRVYGPMMSATAAAPTGIPTPDDPTASAYFIIPESTTNLWFVVLGAPTEHWHHPWDMGTDSNGDDVFTPASLANDEQWPYRLQFIGTSRKN